MTSELNSSSPQMNPAKGPCADTIEIILSAASGPRALTTSTGERFKSSRCCPGVSRKLELEMRIRCSTPETLAEHFSASNALRNKRYCAQAGAPSGPRSSNILNMPIVRVSTKLALMKLSKRGKSAKRRAVPKNDFCSKTTTPT